ncbi:hypothetical protein Pcinc_025976 [Petrolisthes cinctipes]|uniref:Uncharacterized protein n=1 Tax=Petrolisthes cinctipes TaxID=88211 RepID=A0AAE1F8E6_PETCI|nr:hypothetical protein Pcinc_025976 [Petrolisthes cinctipes]
MLQKLYRTRPQVIPQETDSEEYQGNLNGFLQHLIAEPQDEASLSPRIQHLIKSVGQDIVYGVMRGQLKPPKRLMLPNAIKTLTGSENSLR